MARPCSPPVAALTVLLLLCLSYSAAATRLLRDQRNGVAIVKAADAATDDLVALRGEGGNGGKAVSPSEQVMAEGGTAEEEVCEEGNDGDECMQRRLLHDAHLDYIYTQHKGRP